MVKFNRFDKWVPALCRRILVLAGLLLCGMAAHAQNSVTVLARADLAGGVGAMMTLRVNGNVVGTVEVTSTTFQSYVFAVAAGVGAQIDVVFTNDGVVNGADRNLYVQSVSANGVTLLSSSAGVTYDRNAIDGVDVQPGQGVLPWSGALRFPALQAAALPAPPAPVAPVVNYEYDAQGNPTKTVQAPGVTGLALTSQATYDKLDRAKNSTDAANGVTQFGYDGLSRTTSITDPRSLLTQYPRNGLGDTTSLVSPDTGTATHTYYAAGNLKTRTDSRGVLATYSYDGLNRLTGVTYTQAGQTTQSYTWSYDLTGTGYANGIGRLSRTDYAMGATAYMYDPQGRITSDTQRISATSGANSANVSAAITYTYDAGGNITGMVYPSGRKLTIAYAGGLPTGMALAKDAASTATPLLSQIQFDPFGGARSWQWQMTSATQSNTRGYDASGRLVRYSLGGFVRDVAYDAADRITSYVHYDAATGTATAAASAQNQSFGYDPVGRITSVVTATASWSIGYDANGNRTGVTLNGGAPSAYTTPPTSNRLASLTNPARSFGYDSTGNTISDSAGYTATFDLAGRLVTLTRTGDTNTYTYDGMGRRVRKYVSAGTGANPLKTLIFMYDLNGHLLGEYNNAGSALREYVWLGDTPVAMFTPDPANAANPPLVFYIQTDHLDTPRVVLDKNNAVRWRWLAEPFGTSAPETNPQGLGVFTQNLRFPGQYFDGESGLNYNYFRNLDPSIGRYAQSDPIGLGGGINTYAYVSGNPLSYVDPRGLMGQGSGAGSSGPRTGGCTCVETQYSIGVGGSIGGSPVFIPAGFIGGGLGVGFTSNGSLFVQGQATGSVGVGIFGGIGIQGGVSYANAPTSAGMSVSQSLQADFNFGGGPSVGGSVQWTPGSGGGGQTGVPGLGRLGVGYGLQASVGVTQTVTLATPPLFPAPRCQCCP